MRDSGHSPQQFGDQLAWWHALGQSVAMPAMRAEDGICLAQMGAHPNRDRFFSNVGMAGAVYESLLVSARQLLLGVADNKHLTIQLARFSGCPSPAWRYPRHNHKVGRSTRGVTRRRHRPA